MLPRSRGLEASAVPTNPETEVSKQIVIGKDCHDSPDRARRDAQEAVQNSTCHDCLVVLGKFSTNSKLSLKPSIVPPTPNKAALETIPRDTENRVWVAVKELSLNFHKISIHIMVILLKLLNSNPVVSRQEHAAQHPLWGAAASAWARRPAAGRGPGSCAEAA